MCHVCRMGAIPVTHHRPVSQIYKSYHIKIGYSVQFLTFTFFWRICELFIWLDTMLQVTSRDFNLNQYHACSPLILSNISNITSWNSAMVFGSWTLDKFGLNCVSCYPPCTPQCSVFMDDICDLPRRWNAFALRTVLF